MTLAQLKTLIKQGESDILSWDKFKTDRCALKDLDKKLIREFVRLGIAYGRLPKKAEKATIPEILQKFGLLINDRLTNAAVLLFCKNEQKQFMHAEVRLARFEGLTKSVFLDRKDLHGNIFELFEDSMKYLRFTLPIGGRVVPESVYRIDTPAIPFDVLREAVLNALMHRDYAAHGSSIHIAIYDDRVEIDNPGKLPSDVKLSDLTKKHRSVTRNPLIAEVLYTCGMIEQWGRGTLDMIELSKKAGNPLPHFEESGSGFSVILPLREPLSNLRPKMG